MTAINSGCSSKNPTGSVGAAAVRVPGTCGELVQGMVDEHDFLITAALVVCRGVS